MISKDLHKVRMVVTLGSASADRSMVRKLASLGADVFRINMSHATTHELQERIRDIRSVEKGIGRPLAILGDLMGPKIRIGTVQDGVSFRHGHCVTISRRTVLGSAEMISLNFPEILRNLRPSAEIFLGDGDLKLIVDGMTRSGDVRATVAVGGDVRSRMGFSCHGLALSRSRMTAKDVRDVAALVRYGADIIALSFVQHEQDVKAVMKLLPRHGRPLVLAKIETARAVENAARIVSVADGLLIARGDLGFSVPMTEIPYLQQDLIRLCLKNSKPVITATQMLESMMRSPLPTRAEVADVTKAILDGTDAVMLSGETAVGRFPEESVRMMSRIIHRSSPNVAPRDFPDDEATIDAVSASVIKVADQIKARLIVALTESGTTARRIARHRPLQPILALTPRQKTVRDLALVWGTYSIKIPVTRSLEQALQHVRKAVLRNPIATLKRGEPYVISAGLPFGTGGTTNMVLVQRV